MLSGAGSTDVGRCMESLASQSRPVGEVVVVHRSGKAVMHAGLAARAITATRQTRAAARNAGAFATSSELLAFLDSDVRVDPEWGEALVEAWAGGASLVCGPLVVSGDEADAARQGDPEGRNGFLPWASASNLAVSRQLFDELGGFEESLPGLEDADLCFRAQLAACSLVVAPRATGVALPPTVRRRLATVNDGRAETLMGWRFRANPYFAVWRRRPRGRAGAVELGRWLSRIELSVGRRPVPDLVLDREAERQVVMPLVSGPGLVLVVESDVDLTKAAQQLRDRYGLALCPPGPEVEALANWSEPAPWALQLARAASRAGWDISPDLAAKRLEHERPATWGDAYLRLGAVLAWQGGLGGYALAGTGAAGRALSARLPAVPVASLSQNGVEEAIVPSGSRRSQTCLLDDHLLGQRPEPAAQPLPPKATKHVADARRTALRRGAPPRSFVGSPTAVSPDPVLMVSGCPRSGTTLLRNALAAHMQVAIPPEEGYFVTRVYGELLRSGRTDDVETAWRLIREDRHFRSWGLDTASVQVSLERTPPKSYPDLIRLLFAAEAASQGKPLAADKCTSYSMHWSWMAAQFPDSRLVHVLRDPREVCMSLPLQFFHRGGVASAAWWWVFHVRQAPKAAASLGDRWLEIRYEDLVADPGAQLQAVCRHGGIPYDEEMLAYASGSGLPAGSHHFASRTPPQRGIRTWRDELSQDDLVTIERIAGPLMHRFGYEPVTKGVTLGAAAMTARWAVEEARDQWLRSGAPRPSTISSLRNLGWRSEL